MKRVMSATEARVHFGELMRQVAENQDTVVVERGGTPQVVVVAVEEYDRLTAQNAKSEVDDWETRLDRIHAMVKADLNGRPLPSIDDLIRDMREERDAQILAGVL